MRFLVYCGHKEIGLTGILRVKSRLRKVQQQKDSHAYGAFAQALPDKASFAGAIAKLMEGHLDPGLFHRMQAGSLALSSPAFTITAWAAEMHAAD